MDREYPFAESLIVVANVLSSSVCQWMKRVNFGSTSSGCGGIYNAKCFTESFGCSGGAGYYPACVCSSWGVLELHEEGMLQTSS